MMRHKFLFLFLFLVISCYVPNIFSQTTEQLKVLSDLKIDPGLSITIYASDIDSPRQLAATKDGRIYVGSRNSGKIFAIRDTDQNGVVDEKVLVAENLTFATGVSVHDGNLFFSEIDKIWKIENISEKLDRGSAALPAKTLVTNDLPSDKWHGWKWIKHDKNGDLYTNVGAPCNVCESKDKRYASILRLNGQSWEYVARGVRNSVGFDFHPDSDKLYFTDNGRDWLGDDSPSCELNRVDKEGSFYGFPYKHATDVVDPEFGMANTGFDFVDPIAELGAHVAPTGVTFYDGLMFPEFNNNLFITLHGSWNRSSKVGYKVIRISLDAEGNMISTKDFISGWLSGDDVLGRPSAPFVMKDGSILISDDKANLIYRVARN